MGVEDVTEESVGFICRLVDLLFGAAEDLMSDVVVLALLTRLSVVCSTGEVPGEESASLVTLTPTLLSVGGRAVGIVVAILLLTGSV